MSTKRKVILHGRMRELFGEKYSLSASTPAEALRGLCYMVPGFERELRTNPYQFIRGKLENGKAIDVGLLNLQFGKEDEIHVVPDPQPAGLDIAAFILIGVVLGLGVALAFAPKVKTPDANNLGKEDETSAIFDGPTNVSEQGHPVPIVYGKVRVGSVVVSGALETSDIGYGHLPGTASGGFSTPGFGGSPLGIDLVNLEKGGKGGGGSTRTAKEDPNSLKSAALARVVDLISEGEIVGLVNGLKSVYLDGTQVQNADNTYNFKGIDLEFREGLPDQDYIPGYSQLETTAVIDTEVTVAGGAVIHTITDPNVNRARVTLALASLYQQDTTNGDILSTSVSVTIDVQANGGGYGTAQTVTFNGKTNSQYERDILLNLTGDAPWNIRVTRTTADHAESSLIDNTYLARVAAITDAKIRYPDRAVVALTVDARQFGTSIPARSYEIYGKKIKVPSNYDPDTRVYTGVWDGEFQTLYSNNPAWIYYDLLTHKRYGLGKRLREAQVDKYALYQIAQYCDQLVDDGFGGTEPRYTINTVINRKQQAYALLNSVASAIRAMPFWSSGTVSLAQEQPADPVKIITPANVIGGKIVYSGSPLSSMHSVAVVSWNDPDLGYTLTPEPWEDPARIRVMGWKPIELVAWGCTSRGQAQRYARTELDDELYANASATFEVGAELADLIPGDVVVLADPRYTAGAVGGKILSSTSTSAVLDRAVTLEAGKTYTLMVILSDGTFAERVLTNSKPSTPTTVTWTAALSPLPIDGAVWAIKSNVVAPRQFRVIKVEESDEITYKISARLYDPNKFARIEGGISFDPVTYADLPSGPLLPPSGIEYYEYLEGSGDATIPAVEFSWNRALDARVVTYQAQVKIPETEDWEDLEESAALSRKVLGTIAGAYSFRVRGMNALNQKTSWTQRNVTLGGVTGDPVGEVSSVVLVLDNVAVATTIFWTMPTDTRPLQTRVYYNDVGTFGTAEVVAVVQGNTYVVSLEGYYWLQPFFLEAESPSPVVTHVGPDDLPFTDITDLDYTAFASTITPLALYASNPSTTGYTGPPAIFNTTDGQIYRLVAGAWTVGVPAVNVGTGLTSAQIADLAAAKITGTLTNAQIADLAAAKITGTLTNAQIADLAASKVTGQLGDAQIAAIAASKVTGQLGDAQIAAIAAAKVSGQITGTQITDGAISSAKLSAGSVVAGKIAAGTIVAGDIAANAVTADKVAANAITAGKIAAGTIVAGDIASGAITTAKLAASAVTADEIATNAITAVKVSAGAITTAKLAASAVTADEIATNAITAVKVSAGAIETAKIAAGAVTAATIAANAITSAKLSAGSVVAGKIAAGTIVAADIAANAITSAKIATNAITAAKIAAGAITANELAANSVVAGKIAAGAISATEIATNAITAAKIAAGVISADKITVSTLSSLSANLGTITAGSLNIGSGKFTVDSSGNVVIRNADTGQRLQISNSTLEVFNSSNIRVLRLGLWT